MPKYRKKPVEVELIEYKSGVANNYVRLRLNGTPYIWNQARKSEHNIEDGDFINISNPDDIYPIPSHVVRDTYDLIGE